MNLYNVEIVGNVVVAANFPEEAKVKALNLLSTGALRHELNVGYYRYIEKKKDIPDGWNQADLPYGADDDKTIAEYLAECPMQK